MRSSSCWPRFACCLLFMILLQPCSAAWASFYTFDNLHAYAFLPDNSLLLIGPANVTPLEIKTLSSPPQNSSLALAANDTLLAFHPVDCNGLAVSQFDPAQDVWIRLNNIKNPPPYLHDAIYISAPDNELVHIYGGIYSDQCLGNSSQTTTSLHQTTFSTKNTPSFSSDQGDFSTSLPEYPLSSTSSQSTATASDNTNNGNVSGNNNATPSGSNNGNTSGNGSGNTSENNQNNGNASGSNGSTASSNGNNDNNNTNGNNENINTNGNNINSTTSGNPNGNNENGKASANNVGNNNNPNSGLPSLHQTSPSVLPQNSDSLINMSIHSQSLISSVVSSLMAKQTLASNSPSIPTPTPTSTHDSHPGGNSNPVPISNPDSIPATTSSNSNSISNSAVNPNSISNPTSNLNPISSNPPNSDSSSNPSDTSYPSSGSISNSENNSNPISISGSGEPANPTSTSTSTSTSTLNSFSTSKPISNSISSSLYQFNISSNLFSTVSSPLQISELYGASVMRLGYPSPNSDASLIIGGKASDGWISTNQITLWTFDSWAIFSSKNSARVDPRTNPLLIPLISSNFTSQFDLESDLPLVKSALVLGGSVNGHDALPFAALLTFDNKTGWSWNNSIPQQLFEKNTFGAVSFGSTLVTVSLPSSSAAKRDSINGFNVQYIDTLTWNIVDSYTPVSVQSPLIHEPSNQTTDNSTSGNLSTGGKIALSTVLPISGVLLALVGTLVYRRYKSKNEKYEQYDSSDAEFRISNTSYHTNPVETSHTDLHKTSSIRSWQEKLRKYEQAIVGSIGFTSSSDSTSHPTNTSNDIFESPFNEGYQSPLDTRSEHNVQSITTPSSNALGKDEDFNAMHSRAHMNNIQHGPAQRQPSILKRMGTLLSTDGLLGKRRKWSLNLSHPINSTGSANHAHLYANERTNTLKNGGKRSPLLHDDDNDEDDYNDEKNGNGGYRYKIVPNPNHLLPNIPGESGSSMSNTPSSSMAPNSSHSLGHQVNGRHNTSSLDDDKEEDDNDIFEGRDVQVLVSSRRRTQLRVTNPDPKSAETTPDVSRNNSEKSSTSLTNIVNSSFSNLTNSLFKKKSKLGSIKSNISNKSSRSLRSLNSFKSATSGSVVNTEELDRLTDEPDNGSNTTNRIHSNGVILSTEYDFNGDIALAELHEVDAGPNLADLPEEPEDTDSLLSFRPQSPTFVSTRRSNASSLLGESVAHNPFSKPASASMTNITNTLLSQQPATLGRRNTTIGVNTDPAGPLIVRKTRRTNSATAAVSKKKNAGSNALEDVEEEEERSRAVSSGSSFMQIV